MVNLTTWSWIFFVGYIALLLFFGYLGWSRVESQDDYATARGGFGFLPVALTFAATVASGSTFMGQPGLAYASGFKAAYYSLIYPFGIYGGMMLVARATKNIGDRFGSQSVPDFLGDRYQSPGLRVGAAIVATFLITYVMSQIVAAGLLFEAILGVNYQYGIVITGGILLIYLTAGGSYADIITDSVQGAIMVLIALLVFAMFLVGYGMDGGGITAVNAALDPINQWDVHTNSQNPQFANWWTIFVGFFIAHLGFTALPQAGNKFFALKGSGQIRKFIISATVIGMILPLMFFGGILGAAQGIAVDNPDIIIPMLLIQNMPAIVAAFLNVAILSAILSTSDGVVVALSQILANDLYRKSYVPYKGGDPTSEEVNQKALWISRITTPVVIVIAVVAVATPPEFLAVLLWIGVGGIIGSYGGPYLVGVFWEKTTKSAALIGFTTAFVLYLLIHIFPQFGLYTGIYPWNRNPFLSAGTTLIVSCILTVGISFFTEPLPEDHLDEIFRPEHRPAANGGERDSVAVETDEEK